MCRRALSWLRGAARHFFPGGPSEEIFSTPNVGVFAGTHAVLFRKSRSDFCPDPATGCCGGYGMTSCLRRRGYAVESGRTGVPSPGRTKGHEIFIGGSGSYLTDATVAYLDFSSQVVFTKKWSSPSYGIHGDRASLGPSRSIESRPP
jgi:hypothetical protein